MKQVFAILAVVAALLWGLAVLTLDRGDPDAVTLRWATDPGPARMVQTALFSDVHPGIAVSVEGGAMEKLLVQCATGTGPDIIDTWDVSQMSAFVRAGVLLDLTPYAAQMGFAPENTYPAVRDALMVEGRQYRFPGNVAVNAIVYNKAIFDDHGVPYPDPDWTYDEFIETGKLFASPGKSGKTHLAIATYDSQGFYRDLLWGHGGTHYRDRGLASNLDSPEAIAAMQLYHDMLHEHGVLPTPEIASSMSAQGGWGSGAITWFANERAATIRIGRWFLIMLANYPGLAEKLGAVPLPRVGDRPSQGYIDVRGSGISAKSRNKEAALKFLQYLASEDFNRLIVKDGDSLPPNPAYATDGRALTNAACMDPMFHQVFVDAAAGARPIDVSPFMDAMQCDRWLLERIARVENNRDIDVTALMQELAREVNRRIRRNIERNRHLQRKYEDVTGNRYSREWRLSHE